MSVGEFLRREAENNKINKEEKINIVISHNRILEVHKITPQELKEGGKLSENDNYKILDKDYGKSEELMRALLEKKKKIPGWLFALLVVFGGITSIIIMVMTYNIIMSYINPPVDVPKNNPIPLVQNQIKVTPKNEEKQETIITQNTVEFEKIKADYEALEVAYNEQIKKTCESVEIIKEVEKPLTQKDKFIMNLGQSILIKCDNLIKNNIDDKETEICKNLYAKYILSIN